MTIVIDRIAVDRPISPERFQINTFPSASRLTSWIPADQEAVDSLRTQFCAYLCREGVGKAKQMREKDFERFLASLAKIVLTSEEASINIGSLDALGAWLHSMTGQVAEVSMPSKKERNAEMISYLCMLLQEVEKPVNAYVFSDWADQIGVWIVCKNLDLNLRYQLADIHGLLIDHVSPQTVNFQVMRSEDFDELPHPSGLTKIFSRSDGNAFCR